jgi:hypothetical protein
MSRKKERPEVPSPSNPILSAEEMQRRFERLKAEGKVPPLADVLRIVQAVRTGAPLTVSDRRHLRQIKVKSPDYFAPAASAEEEILRRIKGNFRRRMILNRIFHEGLASIPEVWCAHDIPEQFKAILTSMDGPRARGGEDLPDLAAGEVEIVRLTLVDSVHGEVTSLRAKRDPQDRSILLSMVDEYETEFQLSKSKVSAPLTAEEVFATFLDTDPTPLATTCRVAFFSFFYPNLDDLFSERCTS